MAVSPKNLTTQSNEAFFEEALKTNPKFASYVPGGTQARLTSGTVEALSKVPGALNEFYGGLMRLVFEKFDVARARNPYQDIGLMEEWAVPYGEYTQRDAIAQVKPIDPQYRGLENGQSVDMQRVRVPSLEERFFAQNYDFQSLLTQRTLEAKRILLTEGLVGQLMAGYMQGVETGRVVQENLVAKYTMHEGLASTAHPLKSTQVLTVTDWNTDLDAVTSDQLTGLLVAIDDIFGHMFALDCPISGNFNAAGFETRVEKDQYILILRTGIKNRINKKVLAGAFNPNYLNLGIDSIYDQNDFGGLKPYTDTDYTTELFPIMDAFGSETGYYITAENGDALVTAGSLIKQTATPYNTQAAVTICYKMTSFVTDVSTLANVVASSNVAWQDSMEDYIGIIVQRGIMGLHRQNGYTVAPAYPNVAGLYNNYWASAPNNGMYWDYYYNVIALKAPAGA